MPTPTITKQPNDYELANGDVVVSLFDTDEDGGQLGVQVHRNSKHRSAIFG